MLDVERRGCFSAGTAGDKGRTHTLPILARMCERVELEKDKNQNKEWGYAKDEVQRQRHKLK